MVNDDTHMPDRLSHPKDTPGARIRQLRKARGMSQADLADALGCSVQAIYRYENDKRKLTLPLISQLAEIFHAPPASLIPGGDGLSRDERAMIEWLRAHPRDKAVVESTIRGMRENAPPEFTPEPPRKRHG